MKISFQPHSLTLNTIETFCHKFGSKLKKIDFNDMNILLTESDTILSQEFYKFCPNLTHLFVRRFNGK